MQPNDQERAQLRSAIDAELELRRTNPGTVGGSKKYWRVLIPGYAVAVSAPIGLFRTNELIAIREQMDKEEKRHAR